jgi:hypothetical protein
MTNLHTKFHMLSSNDALVIPIRPNANTALIQLPFCYFTFSNKMKQHKLHIARVCYCTLLRKLLTHILQNRGPYCLNFLYCYKNQGLVRLK